MTFAVILGSTAMIQLKKKVELNYIFIMIGSLMALSGVIAGFGIKEMSTSSAENSRESGLKERPKVADNIRSLIKSVKEYKGVGLAFLGNFANKMASIACYTYGTLLIQQSFPESEQNQADDAISIIIMLSNILVVPLSPTNGYLLDRVARWKVLLVNCIIVILSLTLMILTGGRD